MLRANVDSASLIKNTAFPKRTSVCSNNSPSANEQKGCGGGNGLLRQIGAKDTRKITQKLCAILGGAALMTSAVGRIRLVHDNPSLRASFGDRAVIPHEHDPDHEKLNIFIYETDGDREVQEKLLKTSRKPTEVHPHLRLIHSGQSFPEIQIRQLGKKSVFSGFSTKWSWVLQELTAPYLKDDDIVVVGDNRDLLLNLESGRDNSAPIKAFKDYVSAISKDNQGAILISAEEGCCVGALTFAKPGDFIDEQGKRDQRACPSGRVDCQWKYVTHAKAGETHFEQADLDAYARPWISFQQAVARERLAHLPVDQTKGSGSVKSVILNMGLLAGTKKDLIDFIHALDLEPYEDDQAVASDYFFRFPEKVVLDYMGVGFGNNDWQSIDGCKFTQKDPASGQLLHQETLQRPLFLHYPGFNSRPEHMDCLYRDAALLGHNTSALN